jgi:hypothetical protein
LEIDESFWNERTQQENARRFFLTAMGRRSVVEAIWSRWEDGCFDVWEAEDETTRDGDEPSDERDVAARTNRTERDEFPTSGLFDENGRPKPALHKLTALKRAYWG